jgi:hypothetical protein
VEVLAMDSAPSANTQSAADQLAAAAQRALRFVAPH